MTVSRVQFSDLFIRMLPLIVQSNAQQISNHKEKHTHKIIVPSSDHPGPIMVSNGPSASFRLPFSKAVHEILTCSSLHQWVQELSYTTPKSNFVKNSILPFQVSVHFYLSSRRQVQNIYQCIMFITRRYPDEVCAEAQT